MREIAPELAIKSLTASIIMQAVKDFFNYPHQKYTVLRELRSEWMEYITDGLSVTVADELEKHPEEIAERMKKYYEN